MGNLGFLMLAKLLAASLSTLTRSHATHPNRKIKVKRSIDAYKSITFTILKETDTFFASAKHQPWMLERDSMPSQQQ